MCAVKKISPEKYNYERFDSSGSTFQAVFYAPKQNFLLEEMCSKSADSRDSAPQVVLGAPKQFAFVPGRHIKAMIPGHPAAAVCL